MRDRINSTDWTMAKIRHKAEKYVIQCPKCKSWIPVTIGYDLRIHDYRPLEAEFSVERPFAHLFPDFVCLSKLRKCDFIAPLVVHLY